MIWNEEAVEELKRMWERGMTTGQIAKALNVTKNSIIGKVHRLCLTARPSPIKKSSSTDKKDSKEKATPAKQTKKATKETTTTVRKAKETVKQAPKNTKEVPTPAVQEVTRIPLVKLDNHTCRWPLGDPRDEDFCFCGKKIKTGQTYCEEHSAVAYVKPGKKF